LFPIPENKSSSRHPNRQPSTRITTKRGDFTQSIVSRSFRPNERALRTLKFFDPVAVRCDVSRAVDRSRWLARCRPEEACRLPGCANSEVGFGPAETSTRGLAPGEQAGGSCDNSSVVRVRSHRIDNRPPISGIRATMSLSLLPNEEDLRYVPANKRPFKY
jgi:hypothetical protein